MMNQHSPLPWVCGDNGLIYGQCSTDDDEAPCVADVIFDRERAAFGFMTDVERANAALIVRACNSHREIVALLREALMLCNLMPRTKLSDIDSYRLAISIENLLQVADEEVRS